MRKVSFIDRFISNNTISLLANGAIPAVATAAGSTATLLGYGVGTYGVGAFHFLPEVVAMGTDHASSVLANYLPATLGYGALSATALSACEKLSGRQLINFSIAKSLSKPNRPTEARSDTKQSLGRDRPAPQSSKNQSIEQELLSCRVGSELAWFDFVPGNGQRQ